MYCSIIIRTYNEERYLYELLKAISSQALPSSQYEIVIVDSGSIDNTISIAKSFNCRIVEISKSDFTFGRSLNIGCESSKGEILVFISGHCIPVGPNWLENLILPLMNNNCHYIYGRQIGRDSTKFSENQLFNKYFPQKAKIPQDSYFCNNANAAILKSVWINNRFNEELTGLEDMALAKELRNRKFLIGYSSDAIVYHIHNEHWSNVRHRYEREAIALQKIMPEVHISFINFVHYSVVGICSDIIQAFRERVFFKNIISIILFRIFQYWGGYRGNHEHRKISKKMKYKYFYPK